MLCASESQEKDRRGPRKRGADLQRQYRERQSRILRNPPDRKEHNDRNLCGHEQPPEMRRGAFIGLALDAEPNNLDENGCEGCERHCHRNKATRLSEQRESSHGDPLRSFASRRFRSIRGRPQLGGFGLPTTPDPTRTLLRVLVNRLRRVATG